jgi:uncharacterized YigZ family protein
MAQSSSPVPYYSVAAAAVAEQTIKKSRFIAHAFPVSDEAEALRRVEEVRAEYPDASHICYAYKCGLDGEVVRFHDAGEPGGTAGRPILEVIERAGLRNTLITVTRYFGGVLLGASGLARAYSGSAALGVKAAGKALYEWHHEYRLTVSYAAWGRLERLLSGRGYESGNPEFGTAVSVLCFVPEREAGGLLAMLRDITAGEIQIARQAEGYRPTAIVQG